MVAEAGTGCEALRLVKTTRPDVVLMDITMPDLNGLAATASIARKHSAVRVLILSMHDNEQYVTEALRVGARGYVLKDAVPTELALAVEAVARGEIYLSATVATPAHRLRPAPWRHGEARLEREQSCHSVDDPAAGDPAVDCRRAQDQGDRCDPAGDGEHG